jgi:MFS family permease
MFGVFFYVSLYVQQVLGYSPIQAGAIFLPMTLLITFVAPSAGKLVDRIGSRPLVGVGLTLVGGSLVIYSTLGTHSTFWNLLPAMILGGFGMPMTMTPTTAAAMSAVSRDKAGVGSAVLNSARQVGGSIGIALMGAIVASGVSASLSSGHTPPEAFVHGLHNGLLVAAVIAFAGAGIGIATLRKPAHHDAPQAQLVEA